tara:strand:+ start:97 stop:294 length:198 start_codon:yes stop_codon:yes gene_type:complete
MDMPPFPFFSLRSKEKKGKEGDPGKQIRMNNTKLQQMMCGRSDNEKVKFLRHTLMDFCKYIHRRG